MTTEPTPLVTVLPCDRLAAAALIEWQQAATREWKRPDGDEQWQFFHSAFPADIRKGIWDEHDVVQAFARHRLAALEEGREQAAGLAEMGDWDSWSALATAIRALSNKGGRDGE